jgi:hypothetical protein
MILLRILLCDFNRSLVRGGLSSKVYGSSTIVETDESIRCFYVSLFGTGHFRE